ncbi:MAG: ABC transporter substrate-binding protein [Eubacteriales bacterium]|nr:ABC transporter substrate-binding protein [Eubacteriales bacterium]
MKRFNRIISVMLATIFVISMTACSSTNNTGNKKITLNEVAHSIFYAPQYVAIELGYFEEEGIDLTLETGFGADKVMTALVSNEADIGFMGSESSIYVYQEGSDDYAVNFAQLTQRAGNFLVSRTNDTDFKWSDLKGKKVIGGRAGGMPEMLFEYILKKNNISPADDLTILQNVDFGSTSAAFTSGIGDYTIEFEPAATLLEQQNAGYVVASLGTDSGYVPYTAYCAKKSFMDKNPEVIQSFTNAIQKGLDYVNSHTADDIASVIAPQFPETDLDTITTIVERYKSQDTWKENTVFEEESFSLLKNILKDAGELTSDVPYNKLVDTSFARTAAENRR